MLLSLLLSTSFRTLGGAWFTEENLHTKRTTDHFNQFHQTFESLPNVLCRHISKHGVSIFMPTFPMQILREKNVSIFSEFSLLRHASLCV